MQGPSKPPDPSNPTDPFSTSGTSNLTGSSHTATARIPPVLAPAPSAALEGIPFIQKTFGGVKAKVERKLVFLIMAFQGDRVGEVLATVKHECADLKLNAKRVDDVVGSDFVIKEIGDHIEKAEIIVCDLTHERPNVYYELGYAHGVGNSGDNILLIAREGTILHFDIGPLRVHYYSSLESLRAILQRNLPEMHRVVTLKLDSELALSPAGLVPNPVV